MKINYQDYLNSEHWSKRRLKFISKTHKRCFICRGKDNLQVHHKRYYRYGESILFRERHTDLRLLCGRCHTFIHKHGYVKKLASNKIRRKDLRDIILNFKE